MSDWRTDFNKDSGFRRQVDSLLEGIHNSQRATGLSKYGPDFDGDPILHAIGEIVGLELYLATKYVLERSDGMTDDLTAALNALGKQTVYTIDTAPDTAERIMVRHTVSDFTEFDALREALRRCAQPDLALVHCDCAGYDSVHYKQVRRSAQPAGEVRDLAISALVKVDAFARKKDGFCGLCYTAPNGEHGSLCPLWKIGEALNLPRTNLLSPAAALAAVPAAAAQTPVDAAPVAGGDVCEECRGRGVPDDELPPAPHTWRHDVITMKYDPNLCSHGIHIRSDCPDCEAMSSDMAKRPASATERQQGCDECMSGGIVAECPHCQQVFCGEHFLSHTKATVSGRGPCAASATLKDGDVIASKEAVTPGLAIRPAGTRLPAGCTVATDGICRGIDGCPECDVLTPAASATSAGDGAREALAKIEHYGADACHFPWEAFETVSAALRESEARDE